MTPCTLPSRSVATSSTHTISPSRTSMSWNTSSKLSTMKQITCSSFGDVRVQMASSTSGSPIGSLRESFRNTSISVSYRGIARDEPLMCFLRTKNSRSSQSMLCSGSDWKRKWRTNRSVHWRAVWGDLSRAEAVPPSPPALADIVKARRWGSTVALGFRTERTPTPVSAVSGPNDSTAVPAAFSCDPPFGSFCSHRRRCILSPANSLNVAPHSVHW
uniref:Uncharacterized protein n=1 Tax=Anopheles coluzzii TaxID=1518534 RepID=A0A8W7PHL0_ANOCL